MCRFLSTSLVLLVCFATSSLGTEGWQKKEAEVYFVVDGTTSMWKYQFQKQLALVADLVSDMDIGHDRTRVGVGVFSDFFYNAIPLNNTFDKARLIREIKQIPHIKGLTYISRGLQNMRKELDRSMTRAGVPRIGVFFTDGKSMFSSHTYNNATRAKNDGIFLFVIGIGPMVRDSELVDMSSDPKRDFLYKVNDFNDLRGLRNQLSPSMSKVSLYQNDKGTCGERFKVDTVFVYDEFDLGVVLRTSVKKFLSTIADDLRMNPGNMRVGVLSKSCPEGKDINLGDFITREEFKKAVEKDQSRPGLDLFLRDARDKFFHTEAGHRTDAKKRLVLILTNRVDPDKRNNVREQLYRARYIDDIEVFIIRHGSDYDKRFLFDVASSRDHVLFTDMESASEPFLRLFCKDI